MTRLLLALVLTLFAAPALAGEKLQQVPMPKNVVVLGQSQAHMSQTAITVVDTDTGDLVLIYFSGSSEKADCFKLGAKVDLAKQAEVGKK